MIPQKDLKILSHLRNNARKKVTEIARNLGIPVTTIYDKLKAQEKKFIQKHVTLVDFQKIGLNAKAQIAIKVNRDSKDALQKFLMQHPNVNSLHKVNFGSDFLAEVIFKNIGDVENFAYSIEKNYPIEQIQIFNITEELKKEDFLSKPEHFSVLE